MFSAGQTSLNSPDTAGAGSTPAEGNHGVESHESQGQQSSAETQNTDFDPELEGLEEEVASKPGLYNRFKEVNEKVKKYESKKDVYAAYEEMDKLLASDPELYKEVEAAIKKRNAAAAQQYNQNQYQGSNGQQAQGSSQQGQNFDPVVRTQMYMSEFNRVLDAEGITDPAQRDIVYQKAVQSFINEDPNYMVNFNPSRVAKHAKEGAKFLQNLLKSSTATYVEKKQQHELPTTASKGGSAPQKVAEKPRTQQGRSSRLADLMKKRT